MIGIAPAWHAAGSLALTPTDHRTIRDFHPVLQSRGWRHTVTTDYPFSPEVFEIFTDGEPAAAFAVWRERSGIVVADLRVQGATASARAGMADALEWVSSALGETSREADGDRTASTPSPLNRKPDQR